MEHPRHPGSDRARDRKRLAAAWAAALALLLGLAAAPAGAAGGPDGPPAGGPSHAAPPPRHHNVALAAPGSLQVRSLPPPQRGRLLHGPLSILFRPRDQGLFQRAKAGPHAAAGGLAAPVATLTLNAPHAPSAGGASVSGASLPAGGTAALMSLDQQVALFGADQSLVPPDTQVAAGPTDLLELDNATGSVWTKAGALVSAFDLNTFFGVPAQDAGMGAFDPHVLYDAASGRWFASVSATDPTNTYNQVLLAVSQTSDPTGGWNVYTVESNDYGVLYDQPMLGTSGDKVVISWNDFGYGYFMGQETWVLQKSDLVAGAAVSGVDFGPDPYRFRLVPAQDNGTDTAYLVYNNSDATALLQNTSYPSIGVVAVTGTPANGDVRWSEWDPAIAATSVPPNAAQPGGGPAITTDDDRFLSAVWQGGILWTAGNDACVPAGTGSVQSCARLIEISTAGGATVLQDFDAAAAGTDIYYPAVGVDGSGNLFAAFSFSSPSVYASVGATGQPVGGAPGSLQPVVTVAPGAGVYCGFDCSGGSGTNRWGDFSAVATDPSDPTQVWVAGEYAASATDQGDWGTAAQPLTESGA